MLSAELFYTYGKVEILQGRSYETYFTCQRYYNKFFTVWLQDLFSNISAIIRELACSYLQEIENSKVLGMLVKNTGRPIEDGKTTKTE